MDEEQKAGEAPSNDRAAAAAWDAWSEGLRHPQPFDELRDVQKEHWRKVAGAVLSAGEEVAPEDADPRELEPGGAPHSPIRRHFDLPEGVSYEAHTLTGMKTMVSPLKLTGVEGPKDIGKARDDELREREIELRESLKALEAREEQLDLLADEVEAQMALVDRQVDNLLKLLKGEKVHVLLLKAVGIGGGAALVFILVQVVAGLLS